MSIGYQINNVVEFYIIHISININYTTWTYTVRSADWIQYLKGSFVVVNLDP